MWRGLTNNKWWMTGVGHTLDCDLFPPDPIQRKMCISISNLSCFSFVFSHSVIPRARRLFHRTWLKRTNDLLFWGNKKGSAIIDWSSRERSSRGYITLEIREINTDRVYMTTVNLPPKKPIGKAEKEKRKSVKRFSIHLQFQHLYKSFVLFLLLTLYRRGAVGHCVHSLVKWRPSHPSCRRDRIRLWCPSHSLQMMTSEKVAILPISKKDNDLI
jgi:hypothetical protein